MVLLLVSLDFCLKFFRVFRFLSFFKVVGFLVWMFWVLLGRRRKYFFGRLMLRGFEGRGLRLSFSCWFLVRLSLWRRGRRFCFFVIGRNLFWRIGRLRWKGLVFFVRSSVFFLMWVLNVREFSLFRFLVVCCRRLFFFSLRGSCCFLILGRMMGKIFCFWNLSLYRLV